MANLTIRRLDDGVKHRLRLRAAQKGVSLEEEARRVLAESVAKPKKEQGHLVDAITAIVDRVGGIELELPPRGSSFKPATFD